MAKVIYSLKIILYKREMERLDINIFEDDEQYGKLVRFVMFVLHFYVEHWFRSPLAVNAPNTDLTLVKEAIHYKKYDPVVSEAAVHACHLQGWYLSQELVPLSLFDDSLTAQEKGVIATKLMRYVPSNRLPDRSGRSFGKPLFQTVSYGTELVDLIGSTSAFFFSSLKIDPAFLDKPPADWKNDPSFIHSAEKVKALPVINDAAERAVSTAKEFLSNARNEDRYQNNLQVVETNRKELPSMRAKKSKISSWCDSSVLTS